MRAGVFTGTVKVGDFVSVQTDSELFDWLAQQFGTGDGTVEQLRSVRVARDCSVVEVMRIGLFCKTFHHSIFQIEQLFTYRRDAKRWWENQQREQQEQELNGLIQSAAREEMLSGDSRWMNILLRANDRKRVYQQWLENRSHVFVKAA